MSKLIDFVEKEFGKGICVTGKQFVERKYTTIPFSPALDMALGGGIPEGSFCVFTGPPKVGKLLKNNTNVYTPNGPKQIGDIKVGDLVCSVDGDYSIVEEVYPHKNKKIYEVTFDDGNKCYCGPEHLWTVKTRWSGWQTKSLEEMIEYGLIKDTRYVWATPLTEPVYFNEQKVTIPPYLLGALLGDGCITRQISFTTTDKELLDKCNSLFDKGFFFKKKSPTTEKDYFLVTSKQPNKYLRLLAEYGLLGTNSHTKFVPKEYLFNSVNVRKAILQGLMDTDGSIGSQKGSIEYTTTSEQLAKDVKFLVESLGGLCEYNSRYTTYTGCDRKFLSYRLRIRGNNPSMFFSLTRKLEQVRVRIKQPLNRKIKSAILVENADATCIKVSCPKSLFIIDNFVVTHNTTSALDFAGTCQKVPLLDKKGNIGERNVLFLNIEGRLKDRDLKGIKSLDFEKTTIIRSEEGNILSGEKYMEIAEQAINEFPGLIVVIDSFSALCTDARRKANLGDRFRDDTPLLIANFCKRISNVIPVNKTILIGITHMIANQGNGPATWLEASGRKLQYQVDVKLKASHCEDWMAGTSQIGQKVHWECITSAIGPPGMKVLSYLKYGHGLDKGAELVEMAVDVGLIEKGGSWFTFPDKSKVQGVTAAAEIINNDPIMYKEIYDNISTLLNFKKNESPQP